MMKIQLFIILFLSHLPILLAQPQEDCDLSNYNRLIREAEEYAYGKNGNAVNYKKAIDKLFSARTCQPAKESEVSRKILEVFEKVNGERNRAEAALRQVEKEKAATEEQRKIAQQNFEMAQKATEEAENALNELKKSNEEVVKLLLENTERDILNLRFEDALEKIKASASLGSLKYQVTKAWLEIAFWYAESGNSGRAYALIDSLASYATINLQTTMSLREKMSAIDPIHFKFLWECKYYPEMVPVEGGVFIMGCEKDMFEYCSDRERPKHNQPVESFKIAKYETTVLQYALFCAATGKNIKAHLIPAWSEPGNNPVVNIRWYDALFYADWVSQQKGGTFRLPTEAEWEFAARGGNGSTSSFTIYSGHNILDSVGWFHDNSGGRTQPVGQKKANALGLYDMSGNVTEWCSDWYASYVDNPNAGYSGPVDGDFRVLRGGDWFGLGKHCSVFIRSSESPLSSSDSQGFRLAQ
ncbi:MAG: SUMF1/EgtB/PvdO family nonheme iron enzyme [Saprospiraceae bacterium]